MNSRLIVRVDGCEYAAQEVHVRGLPFHVVQSPCVASPPHDSACPHPPENNGSCWEMSVCERASTGKNGEFMALGAVWWSR